MGTEESSSLAEVGTTKPIEVWTLRPNWSTGGSTLQNEETTNAVSLADGATVIEVTTTEKISTIGDVVTTEAAKTTQDTTPAFTISASTSEVATEPSIVTAEESITESESKEIITTTALPLAEDSSVTTDVTDVISVTTDSDVTTDSYVTTESSDEKELPEVKLEREENEVEIDAESETEKNESSAVEEFAVERPRSLSLFFPLFRLFLPRLCAIETVPSSCSSAVYPPFSKTREFRPTETSVQIHMS